MCILKIVIAAKFLQLNFKNTYLKYKYLQKALTGCAPRLSLKHQKILFLQSLLKHKWRREKWTEENEAYGLYFGNMKFTEPISK